MQPYFSLGIAGDRGLRQQTIKNLDLFGVPHVAALAGSALYLREFVGLSDNRTVLCAIPFGCPDRGNPAECARPGDARTG